MGRGRIFSGFGIMREVFVGCWKWEKVFVIVCYIIVGKVLYLGKVL